MAGLEDTWFSKIHHIIEFSLYLKCFVIFATQLATFERLIKVTKNPEKLWL